MRRVDLTGTVITGIGVALPGALTAGEVIAGRAADAEPVDPAALVGRKGLRYKDRATRLAYCAADAALRDAELVDETALTVPAASVGVIGCSTFGNADTVVNALDTIAAETVTGTSPMDLPNASSNVVASSVAIKFGLQGPNLMVCSGATSGLDAVQWAATMLSAGRAERVLVVGVEPDTMPVRTLLVDAEPLDGAVAVVVETAASASARGVASLADLGRFARAADVGDCLDSFAAEQDPVRWAVPAGGADDSVLPGVPRDDLTAVWGASSAALGVLQCVAAAGRFASGADGPVYACAGATAMAGIALYPPGGAR